MTLNGHIQNGAIVLDQPVALPDGSAVRVEVQPTAPPPPPVRRSGLLAGQPFWMAPDFDEWPEDMQEALGMKE